MPSKEKRVVRIEADRLVWLPEDFIGRTNVEFLKETLTFTDNDESREIALYEQRGGMFGVPKAFYSEYLPVSPVADASTVGGSMPPFQRTFRDGQEEAVREVLRELRTDEHRWGGILRGKCGSGKTCAGLAIASELGTKTLILVHKEDLLEQWKEECEFFLGETPGFVWRDRYEVEGPLTIGMVPTVYSRLETLKERGFFRLFGTVLQDECHHVSASTFEAVIRQSHARYRIGLSATPRRRDGLEKVFFYHLGSVLTVMETETLTGTYIQVPWETAILEDSVRQYDGRINYSRLVTAITEDAARNRWLADEIRRAQSADRTVMALTARRAHAEFMADCLSRHCGSVKLYYGGMKKEDLHEAQKADVIVSTYRKLAEATDIPHADTLFVMTPVSDVEQTVGRIQRIFEDKKEPMIVDPVDNIGLCLGMAKKRRTEYEKLGFTRQ